MNQKADWSPFHDRLHRQLRQNRLLPQQARILIAVSGGQDSLCLGKLIVDLQSKWQWHIAIAHCNHNWATDGGIAERVREIANGWSLEFHLQEASNLKETEAAAREWRYRALIDIARTHNFDFVVTGHTKSDRAETFLYNLIRGAGADGLSSLNWQRNLTTEIKLVRPLLDFTRRETLTFCQQFELPICVDVVNSNLKYARNRIRQQLIPYLQTNFNERVENSLVQTAELLRADSQYLESQVTELSPNIIDTKQKRLNRIELRALPLALQRRVIRKFLPSILQQQPNFSQIESIRYLISAPQKSRTSSLAKGITAEVSAEWIVFLDLTE